MSICHVASIETVQRLAERKNGSWRALALSLGYDAGYAATLCDVVRGKPGCISREGENVLRARLGLPPRTFIEVAPCPDCGSAHTGRCHGKPVVRVQIVSGKPRNRKKYHRPCMDDETYAQYLQWRRNANNT